MGEKPLSPLFCVCVIHRNKDEILDKVFVVFISFISPILYKIIKEAKHNMAEFLALLKSHHGVSGSNPADGEILSEAKRRFIAQGLSCLPFNCPVMTEIRLKWT